jgi:hypothetical protein
VFKVNIYAFDETALDASLDFKMMETSICLSIALERTEEGRFIAAFFFVLNQLQFILFLMKNTFVINAF